MPHYPEQQCKMCNRDLSHKRIDAQYCDNRCRMRYNRYQEKKDVIRNIVDICAFIPHNTAQTPEGITKYKVKDLKTGNAKHFSTNTLASLSQKRLKEILKQKRMEQLVYQTSGRII